MYATKSSRSLASNKVKLLDHHVYDGTDTPSSTKSATCYLSRSFVMKSDINTTNTDSRKNLTICYNFCAYVSGAVIALFFNGLLSTTIPLILHNADLSRKYGIVFCMMIAVHFLSILFVASILERYHSIVLQGISGCGYFSIQLFNAIGLSHDLGLVVGGLGVDAILVLVLVGILLRSVVLLQHGISSREQRDNLEDTTCSENSLVYVQIV